jgi:hypothetical protein
LKFVRVLLPHVLSLTNGVFLTRSVWRLRFPDSFHEPFHFFSANERLKKHAKLNRAKSEKLHHLGKIFWLEGLPVHCDIPISKSANPIFSAEATRQTYRFSKGSLAISRKEGPTSPPSIAASM